MKFTILIAGLLAGVALAGCVNDDNYQDSTMSPKPAEYPSVDAGFLSAVEWRFVGPYRGGRVIAVAGVPYDRWLRFILPFMVKIGIAGSIALVVAILIGYA